MNRTFLGPCSVALVFVATAVAACSGGGQGESPDAAADVLTIDGGADTARPPGDDAADDATSPDATDAHDAADTRDAPADAAGPTLSPQRVADVRACMDARWGSSPTRAAIDVADDFDACTTAAENTGAVGDANFALVLQGWAEPDPSDHSLMRKVAAHDH